ncbi:SAV_6107 family HEPN domain-containing protein, partial [Streptomyces sp. NPDC054766]
ARIRSAWEVLPEIAPELTEWSALFSSGATRRGRPAAGRPGAAPPPAAPPLRRAAPVSRCGSCRRRPSSPAVC